MPITRKRATIATPETTTPHSRSRPSAAVFQRRELALLAAVLGLVGALSVYAQVASGNVWLGGTNVSAAFLLCAAMVSVVVVRWIDKPMGAVQTGRFGRAGQSHA